MDDFTRKWRITCHGRSPRQESISRRFRLAFGPEISILYTWPDINGDLVCSNRRPSCRNASFESGEGGLPPTRRRHLRRRRRVVQQSRRDQYEKVPGRGNPPRFRETVDVPFLFPNPSARSSSSSLFRPGSVPKETRRRNSKKERRDLPRDSTPMSYDLEREDTEGEMIEV